MLTLIRREIQDNIVGVATPCLAGIIMVALAVYLAYSRSITGIFVPVGMLTFVLLIGFSALGAAQMYGDRANRISSLLSTQAVTRSRILAARVLVGVLTVLVSLVPVAVTITILLWVFVPPLEFYRRMIAEISVTVVLTAIACYCIGLLIGWTTSKAWLLAGNLLLTVLLVSIVCIKGFGPDVAAILLLLIGATLLRVWQTFTSTSL